MGGNPLAILATFSLLTKSQAASLTGQLLGNAFHVTELAQLRAGLPNAGISTKAEPGSLAALLSAKVTDLGVLSKVPVYKQSFLMGR
jgi:hypothetical protein